MPEINATFTKGRMNLDLDEKLLPNGEYRGALNIQVSTSDENSVGSVQPVMGNEKINNGVSQIWPDTFECIGSIADEKNDVAYWFIVGVTPNSSVTSSAILRVFINTNPRDLEIDYVLVDVDNSVLEFTVENYITGVSIVDNFLYFTDNVTEPKVINIEQFLLNTSHDLQTASSDLYINGENKGPVTKNDITVIKPRPLNPITVEVVPGDEKLPVYNIQGSVDFTNSAPGSTININFDTSNLEYVVLEAPNIYDPDNDGVPNNLPLSGVDPVDGNVRSAWSASNNIITPATQLANTDVNYYDFNPITDIKIGDVLLLAQPNIIGSLPNNAQARLKVQGFIANADPATNSSLTQDLVLGRNRNVITYAAICEILDVSNVVANEPTTFEFMKEDLTPIVFEKVFSRFSYRYKYSDNQYSPFAPFTQVTFLPSKFNIHPTKEPYNIGMENNIQKIKLKDFIHQGIPKQVTEVDLLYKSEDSPTIYLLDTIKPILADGSENPKWFTIDGTGGANSGKYIFSDGTTSEKANTNSGYYELTKELIYSAIPENQSLRIFDNVPKKAKSQDFTAGRIIYGNYTQNLDVKPFDNTAELQLEERYSKGQVFNDIVNGSSFDTGALRSVKSERTYQLGISLLDYQGRETPVYTSGEIGSFTIPFNSGTVDNFIGNASRSNRLKAYFPGGINVPSHANTPNPLNTAFDTDPAYDPYYFKLYIKETSSEYYNLVLDRVYRAKEDGNLWLSFPSSDRNKIKEDDFIILKKALDDDIQVQRDNKFKVIAIENEAPDFIRDKFRTLGQANGDGTLEDLYTEPAFQPAPGARKIVINKTTLVNELVAGLQQRFNSGDELSIRFKKTSTFGAELNSERYNIVNLTIVGDEYIITFDKPIKNEDAWIEIQDGVLHPDLVTIFFIKENTQWIEFQGRFFVKIASNIVSGQYLEPQIGLDVFEAITARAKTFSLRDGDLFRSLDSATRYSGTHDYGQDTTANTNSVISNITNRTINESDFEDIFNHETNNAGTDGSDWFIDELHYIAQQPLELPNTNTGNYDSANQVPYQNPARQIYGAYDASISGNLRGMNWNPTYGSAAYTSGTTFTFPDSDQNGTIPPLEVTPSDTFKRSATGSPMNGMQGIVTTVTGHLNKTSSSAATPWPLAWKRQLDHIDNSSFGVENYRDVYGDSTGKHFMHLSFSGVGVDLIREEAPIFLDENPTIGPGAAGLSVTTSSKIDLESIVNLNRQKSTADGGIGKILDFPQEVNSSNDPNWELKIKHQWDPVGHEDLGNFSIANQSFLELLQPGQKFRFSNDTNGEIFQIVKIDKVRVYNHTSWNRSVLVSPGAATNGHWVPNIVNSVGTKYDTWYSAWHANPIPGGGLGSSPAPEWDDLRQTIINFGKANNRRICYIIELDRDPTAHCSINPENLDFDFDGVNDDFGFIEFFEQDFSDNENPIRDNPAIFETEPREKIDLDIYYEASPIYPISLDMDSAYVADPLTPTAQDPDNTKGYLSARVSSRAVMDGPPAGVGAANIFADSTHSHFREQIDCRVKSWDGQIVVLSLGLFALSTSFAAEVFYVDPLGGQIPADKDDIVHQDYVFKNKLIRFYDEQLDGYISYRIDQVLELSTVTPFINGVAGDPYTAITKIAVKPRPTYVGLPYYNCFAFGNGVESNRIRDDFNKPFIKNGARVSTTLDDQYKQDVRTSGLIFSGIYNKNTNLNDLNQFIQAENITKDLDPTYGSIQKLFARNSDLVALCEDKIVQIFADKDLIFNADGNTQLTASNKVLGQSRPFVGEYGISKNPESFASSSYRAYFTDKQRGAVLRLSMDGLTPISDQGMRDWFRDKLKNDYYRIVGSYDKSKQDYNLTFDTGQIFALPSSDYNLKEPERNYTHFAQSITVTYKENVKGWSSFKGFIQESGVVINNEYITFRYGKAYHHNESVSACSFYDNPDTVRRCEINVIFNDAPTTIKSFNTLNYTGEQGWRCEVLQTEKNIGNIFSTSFGATSIIDNPESNVFSKKEDKFFAYIQANSHLAKDSSVGSTTGAIGGFDLDVESSSFLGLGEKNRYTNL